jgi:hypothetical protein
VVAAIDAVVEAAHERRSPTCSASRS